MRAFSTNNRPLNDKSPSNIIETALPRPTRCHPGWFEKQDEAYDKVGGFCTAENLLNPALGIKSFQELFRPGGSLLIVPCGLLFVQTERADTEIKKERVTVVLMTHRFFVVKIPECNRIRWKIARAVRL